MALPLDHNTLREIRAAHKKLISLAPTLGPWLNSELRTAIKLRAAQIERRARKKGLGGEAPNLQPTEPDSLKPIS